MFDKNLRIDFIRVFELCVMVLHQIYLAKTTSFALLGGKLLVQLAPAELIN
jgi:hypothetical protein